MQMYGGMGISTHFNLGTRWRGVVSFTPWPLYSRGKSPATHRKEAGHGLEPVSTLWRRTNPALLGIEPSSPSLYPSHYTAWAIPAPHFFIINLLILSSVLPSHLSSNPCSFRCLFLRVVSWNRQDVRDTNESRVAWRTRLVTHMSVCLWTAPGGSPHSLK
jgi:hypothetical protein